MCNGAAKAIFIRGLPEMNVQNIFLNDMVLQAKEGLDCIEGSGISLKNVQLLTGNTNSVINIHNSRNITLDQIIYKPGVELLINITGEKTGNIHLLNTDTSYAKNKVQFNSGAAEKALQYK